MASTRSAYDAFAAVYSSTMAEDFARRTWPAIERLLLKGLAPGTEILDLCCGAGQISHFLSERGFHTTGVDSSPAMIRLARHKTPRTRLLVADARLLPLKSSFHAALSTFNSLAHLYTAEDLRAVFREVRSALLAPGRFLFDLTMEEGYLHGWHGSFEIAAGGYTCRVHPGYDPGARMAHNAIVCVPEPEHARRGERASRFTILQKCHSFEEISSALKEAGFESIQRYDAMRDLGLDRDFGRSFFLAIF